MILDGLRGLLSGLTSKFSRKVETDITPVFIPLDLKSLNVTLGSIVDSRNSVTLEGNPAQPKRADLRKLRTKILTFINASYKNKLILTGKNVTINGRPDVPLDIIMSKHTPAIVYLGGGGNDNIIGIIFNKFSSAQAQLFDQFLNKELVKFTKETLAPDFDRFGMGVLFNNDQAPLAKKVSLLSRILSSFSKSNVKIQNVNVTANKGSVLRLRATVDALLKSYARTNLAGPKVDATITKTTSNFLNSIRADIVVIQDEGATEALKQAMFSDKTTKVISDILVDTKVAGKPSFLQSIKNRIEFVWLGKELEAGKPQPKVVKKIPVLDKRKSARVGIGGIAGKNNTVNFPQARTSIVDLQALINNSLALTVRKNMGTGDSGDVLNYRTGRLAGSAKVELVSQSREGAVTAFYSYMRFPYGTFAEGGEQQFPLSRDPTKLIDKSIRQIAAEKAGTQLRTVLI